MPLFHFVLVAPPAGLKTADVYQAHDELPGTLRGPDAGVAKELAAAAVSRRWPEPKSWMRNRLWTAAATLSPWIEELRSVFDRLDCRAHQLSGSGSAYFGVCRHAPHARRLANLLRTRQLGLVYATKSYR
jgi:4-diphosphocytidyl-2-C-methyl-D-erythritol kinase